MADDTCSRCEDSTNVVARGLCPRCYANERHHGRLERWPKLQLKQPTKPCSIDGCDNSHLSRGWCAMHYARWSRNGDPLAVQVIKGDDQLRLWSQVDRRGPDDCWPWTGRVDDKGRAAWQVGATKTARPYRMAYELEVGPIPNGLTIDHLCHTRDLTCPGGPSCLHRRCCNPSHLEPVTAEVNTSRANRALRPSA